MELEQLRIFIAVAEHGSYSAAAKDLFVSHSTTSRAVSALENELGVTLFDRKNRILGLTQAGESLLRDARELLENAAQLKNNLKEFR
ncbi:MAG: LysR family transcriptional regulator [Oscillospiraceae bacterium]|nr:LysR family transcriptional regulator [Oscillospiraceae bacterium]